MRTLTGLLIAALMVLPMISGADVVLNSTIASETSLAHDATYSADLQNLKVLGL